MRSLRGTCLLNLSAVVCIGAVILLWVAVWGAQGLWSMPTHSQGFFAFMLFIMLLFFAIMWGVARVDGQGVRLHKVWTRVRIVWKDVRCVGSFTYAARHNITKPYLLIATVPEPWSLLTRGGLDRCMDIGYFRRDGECVLILPYTDALRAAVKANCALPWTKMRYSDKRLFAKGKGFHAPEANQSGVGGKKGRR